MNDKSLEIIDAKIAKCNAAQKELEDAITDYHAQIESCKQELYEVAGQYHLYTNLRKEIAAALGHGDEYEGLKPSQAILLYLKENGPRTGVEIFDALEAAVKSDSTNVRQNLSSTLSYLMKKGDVVKSDDKYELSEDAVEYFAE